MPELSTMVGLKTLTHKLLSRDNQHTDRFTYEIGWATDYGALFRNETVEVTGIEDVLKRARQIGRAILVGKGGSGKSTILNRLFDEARARKQVAVLVNLKYWSTSFQNLWECTDVVSRADLLLSELGQPKFSLEKLDSISADQEKWIFIDGLNEVRASAAEQIIFAADKLASTIPLTSVIVSDRMTRRDLRKEQWALGMVRPLSELVVKRALKQTIGLDQWDVATASQRRLLDNPFFLNKTIKEGKLASNNAEAIRTFLSEHASLYDDEIEVTSAAAFEAYSSKTGSRTFRLAPFQERTGDKIVSELIRSGTLVIDDDQAYFEHHLLHDYLASRYVASQRQLWNEDSFDALTFGASSFDAIALILQELPSAHSDDFLKQAYDWNPYAAAYAISEAEGAGVSPEMGFVISLMLVERLNDIFEYTAQRSGDALSVLGPTLEQMIGTSNKEQLRESALAQVSNKKWFQQWQMLFTTSHDSSPNREQIDYLQSPDPIIGWTGANVLRRLSLGEEFTARIRSLTNPTAPNAVRWRAAHVLGRFPAPENKDVLLHCVLNDQYEWVRYGSLRSLMEIAARSVPLRSSIFEALMSHLDVIESSPRLAGEFARAAIARDPQELDSWIAGLRRLLRTLADRTIDTDSFSSWIKLGTEIDSFYATPV
jgi:hypothetical protein